MTVQCKNRRSLAKTGFLVASLVLAGTFLLSGAASTYANASSTTAEATASGNEKKRRLFQKVVIENDCDVVEPVCSKNVFRVRDKRRVEIASVSCDIFASGQGDLGFVSLVKIDDKTGDSTRLDFFTPVNTVEASFKEYVFNSLTRVSVGAGNTLAILAKDSDGMRSLTCKISGELVIFK